MSAASFGVATQGFSLLQYWFLLPVGVSRHVSRRLGCNTLGASLSVVAEIRSAARVLARALHNAARLRQWGLSKLARWHLRWANREALSRREHPPRPLCDH